MAGKTYMIHHVSGSLKVTIPRVLAEAVGLKEGDKVKWVIDRGELVLRKAD